MKKNKNKKVKIPNYSLGEELINAISHGLGVGFGITALVLCIVAAAKNGSAIGVVCACIYGASMIIMYLMSCLYHSFSRKCAAKKAFRVIDHCDIYVFIAGCYTPYCLCLIGGVIGWVMFSAVWLCAIIGILLNAINIEKNEKVSMVLYLLMGWMIIFSLKTIVSKLATVGLLLLLLGGVVYTVGAIIYGLGAKNKYFHSVFHFFVLAASILQFFSIYLYVL